MEAFGNFFCACAGGIERKKIRAGFGIPYNHLLIIRNGRVGQGAACHGRPGTSPAGGSGRA